MTENIILIDMVTGTVMNYDDKVVMVDVSKLSDYGQMLYDEWNETGSDSTIMALGNIAGTPIPNVTLPTN